MPDTILNYITLFYLCVGDGSFVVQSCTSSNSADNADPDLGPSPLTLPLPTLLGGLGGDTNSNGTLPLEADLLSLRDFSRPSPNRTTYFRDRNLRFTKPVTVPCPKPSTKMCCPTSAAGSDKARCSNSSFLMDMLLLQRTQNKEKRQNYEIFHMINKAEYFAPHAETSIF